MSWRVPAQDATHEHDVMELAKQAQDPLSDLMRVPMQLDSGFNTGPRNNTRQEFSIEPIIPQEIDEDSNWIHRANIPYIDQPSAAPGARGTSGLGNIFYEGLYTPSHSEDDTTWGFGPAVQLPTSQSDRLGEDEWAVGPALAVVRNNGPWVVGTRANHLWGVEHDDQTNLTTLEPFANYNFDDGWYVTSAPTMTANWDASEGGNVWTVPLGGGVGRTFHMGDQAVDMNLQAFSNVQRPHGAPEWTTRLQFALLFPRNQPRGSVN